MQFASKTIILAGRLAGILLLVLTAFLPVAAQENAPTRVVIVDSSKFNDSKTGIKKLANAYLMLELQVASVRAEIVLLRQRYLDLEKKIQSGNCAAKNYECARLMKEFDELKKETEKSLSQGRKIYQEQFKKIVDPVFGEIAMALKDYKKAKKDIFVYDIAEDSLTLIICRVSWVEVTDDFIEYFNNHYH